MKPFTLFLFSLMVVTGISCGKKAEVDKKKAKENLEPTQGEIYFNALKEIERSVKENDLKSLKQTVAEHPGIDLNQLLHNGDTFLIMAIRNDFREIRNFLIDANVQLEKPNINKRTPLMVAALHKRENTVRVLLDRKVDLEKKDASGDTALHMAIKNSSDDIALLLIKNGANVEATDGRDRNALKLAETYNVPNAFELIKSIMQIEYGAPDLAGFRSILIQGDLKRLGKVLNRYPNIAQDAAYEAINPLALLVDVKDEMSALRSAELLINHRANVNGPLNAEYTPLIKATVARKKGFANLYLQSNANPQLQDKDGKSALIHAVEMNNLELVELLLSFSAPENYSFRKDGKKYSFKACDVARNTEKKLTSQEEKDINKEIKDRLDCGFLNWLF